MCLCQPVMLVTVQTLSLSLILSLSLLCRRRPKLWSRRPGNGPQSCRRTSRTLSTRTLSRCRAPRKVQRLSLPSTWGRPCVVVPVDFFLNPRVLWCHQLSSPSCEPTPPTLLTSSTSSTSAPSTLAMLPRASASGTLPRVWAPPPVGRAAATERSRTRTRTRTGRRAVERRGESVVRIVAVQVRQRRLINFCVCVCQSSQQGLRINEQGDRHARHTHTHTHSSLQSHLSLVLRGVCCALARLLFTAGPHSRLVWTRSDHTCTVTLVSRDIITGVCVCVCVCLIGLRLLGIPQSLGCWVWLCNVCLSG